MALQKKNRNWPRAPLENALTIHGGNSPWKIELAESCPLNWFRWMAYWAIGGRFSTALQKKQERFQEELPLELK